MYLQDRILWASNRRRRSRRRKIRTKFGNSFIPGYITWNCFDMEERIIKKYLRTGIIWIDPLIYTGKYYKNRKWWLSTLPSFWIMRGILICSGHASVGLLSISQKKLSKMKINDFFPDSSENWVARQKATTKLRDSKSSSHRQ